VGLSFLLERFDGARAEKTPEKCKEIEMGGVTKYPYPKFVWSQSGGWWRDNHGKWQRALAVAMGTIALVSLWGFNKSRRIEEWSRGGAFPAATMSMSWNSNPASPHRSQY